MPSKTPRNKRQVKYDDRKQPAVMERNDPETVAAVAEAVVDDQWIKIAALAREVGMPDNVVSSLVDRLRKRYSGVVAEVRKVTTPDLLKLMDERLMMALEYMSDVKMAEAGVRDLAIMFGILAEKRAMMRGEPTQIVSLEERRNLMELVPELVKEAQRRGMVIEHNPMAAEEVGKPAAHVLLSDERKHERVLERAEKGLGT